MGKRISSERMKEIGVRRCGGMSSREYSSVKMVVGNSANGGGGSGRKKADALSARKPRKNK